MADIMYCTEAEVKDILLKLAKDTDDVSAVFIAYREQKPRQLQREVTFVIQTKEGNEELVNSIVKYSAEHEMELRFLKSDINVQGGNMTIDYLYVQATIYPKLS